VKENRSVALNNRQLIALLHAMQYPL